MDSRKNPHDSEIRMMINGSPIEEKNKSEIPESENKQVEKKDENTAPVEVDALVECARKGDRRALENLFDLFHNDVFRMVYYRTGSKMDAEDLTQDIFMQIVKSLPDLRNPQRFKSWLFSIAINRVRDFYRKSRNRYTTVEMDTVEDKTTETEDIDTTPLDYVLKKEFVSRFQTFTEALSKGEKEVFILRFANHMGIREISETLNKNESTVKTHLYRAIKKFRNDSDLYRLLKREEV